VFLHRPGFGCWLSDKGFSVDQSCRLYFRFCAFRITTQDPKTHCSMQWVGTLWRDSYLAGVSGFHGKVPKWLLPWRKTFSNVLGPWKHFIFGGAGHGPSASPKPLHTSNRSLLETVNLNTYNITRLHCLLHILAQLDCTLTRCCCLNDTPSMPQLHREPGFAHTIAACPRTTQLGSPQLTDSLGNFMR
jgi:hypothetical protein